MPNLPAGRRGAALLFALAVVSATATLVVGNDVLRIVFAVFTFGIVGVAVNSWTEQA